MFLSKVARPATSHERGEGDPHQVHNLRTKVAYHFCAEYRYCPVALPLQQTVTTPEVEGTKDIQTRRPSNVENIECQQSRETPRGSFDTFCRQMMYWATRRSSGNRPQLNCSLISS